jgi:hypothetical protein
MIQTQPSATQNVLLEVWAGFRPYFVRFTVDFLVSTSLWTFLWAFKRLTQLLSLQGWAADVIIQIHAVGSVSAFVIFAILFAVDIYAVHRGGEGR